jgi:hypothetical protein
VLLKTNNLSILQKLFDKIVIPKEVYREITAKEQEKLLFDNVAWIEIRDIKNTDLSSLLKKLVDKGEAEAIILAKELKTVLLVDDAKARKHAILLDVEVMGVLGLLKMAKKRGVIPSVKKIISDMLAEGYYVEDKLVTRILEDVGES